MKTNYDVIVSKKASRLLMTSIFTEAYLGIEQLQEGGWIGDFDGIAKTQKEAFDLELEWLSKPAGEQVIIKRHLFILNRFMKVV